MTLRRRRFIYTILFLFSPILVPLFVLYILLTCLISYFVTANHNQVQSAKVLGFEFWNKAPGIQLLVQEIEKGTSDIIISRDFVNSDGNIDTCKGVSLRKSIEYTVQEHLRAGPYGAKIENDSDRDEPHYLLHGWTEPYDPNGDELWVTHARTATWAAIYSWTGRLPPGGWQNPKHWIQTIDANTVPDDGVLGYVYLFRVGNPGFYNTTEWKPRTIRVGGRTINAPEHTPQTEGKIFARYNYGQVRYMGNFPKGDPDAYIFKGKALRDAQLQVLHRYRIVTPRDP